MDDIDNQLRDALDEIQYKVDESINELDAAALRLKDTTSSCIADISKSNAESERLLNEIREMHKNSFKSTSHDDIADLHTKLNKLMKFLNIQ